MSFIKRKKHVSFESAVTEEGTSYLGNPSLGWYRIYPFALEKKPDYEELYWCLVKEETIALVIADIGAFRDADISEEALCNLSDILEFFKKNEKEIILRITYDREGRGMEREPDFLGTVENHMQKLGPVILRFKDQILIVQGILVGSWGEMHDSKFLSKERLRRLAGCWREALGEEIAIAVRTPQQWRFLHSKEEKEGKTGLFDDGIFGSADNLGTYGRQEREKAVWQEQWRKEDELDFVSKISDYLPYGGEAVGGEELPFCVMAEELRRTGVCYLNRTHDMARLNQWKEAVWQEEGVWNGINGFDYIGCHLGYRFVVRKAEFIQKKEPHLRILIENTGFSTLKEETEQMLFFRYGDGKETCISLSGDLQGIGSGETKEFYVLLPEPEAGASYTLFLKMKRKRDGRELIFANAGAKDGVLLGVLVYR